MAALQALVPSDNPFADNGHYRIDMTTKSLVKTQKIRDALVLREELRSIFLDRLPRTELSSYALGVLVGEQKVLDKIDEIIEIEKEYDVSF